MEYLSTVYIVNSKKQFLMQYNSKQKAWLPPGGFLEPGEFIYQAAIRETKEEIGKKIGGTIKFMGNVAFNKAQLDERTTILPTPIFVAKQTLTNGKILENFIYLAITDELDIEVQDFKPRWYNYDEIENLDTFVNVKMQIKYIYDNFMSFALFPDHENDNAKQYQK